MSETDEELAKRVLEMPFDLFDYHDYEVMQDLARRLLASIAHNKAADEALRMVEELEEAKRIAKNIAHHRKVMYGYPNLFEDAALLCDFILALPSEPVQSEHGSVEERFEKYMREHQYSYGAKSAWLESTRQALHDKDEAVAKSFTRGVEEGRACQAMLDAKARELFLYDLRKEFDEAVAKAKRETAERCLGLIEYHIQHLSDTETCMQKIASEFLPSPGVAGGGGG